MADKLEIVDAHMHLWTPETHPWTEKVKDGGHPAGNFDVIVPYLVENYQTDIAGFNVTRSVHVEALWPGDSVGETNWLDGIADGNTAGIPHAIIGSCDLSSSDAEEVLKRHIQSKRVRGIRQMLNFHPDKPQYSETKHDNYLTDPNWIRSFALLEKYQLSFDLQILPRQMQRAVQVVKQYPKVMIILDHCGTPYDRDEENMKIWRDGLQELAKCPNMYCKVSGMFATDPKWDQKSVESVVKPVLEIFGIDRCVFASNFPVDRLNGTFPQLISSLMTILQPYSLEDKQKFFSGNAKKFYRLNN